MACVIMSLPIQTMKPTRTTSAFTLIELLVVISIIGILITIAVPSIGTALDKARMTETLANAKSLQTATLMMTLDSQQSGDGIQWTSAVDDTGSESPVSLSTYFQALTNDGYMTQSELRKVLSAPGKNPTAGTFSAGTIAFKIFQVSDNSPSDQPFVVTANWSPGGGMSSEAQPYGNKGFVVFNKGGGGGVYNRPRDATSTNIFPPAGTGPNGETYKYTILN